MKFLQYLILTILIANGSLPLLQDMALDTGNEQLIAFFEQVDSFDACEDQDSEGEDASDDDLVSPENHVTYEPKPHDSSTENHSGHSSTVILSHSHTQNYNTADWDILTDHLRPIISSELLRHTYFSKRNVDIS